MWSQLLMCAILVASPVSEAVASGSGLPRAIVLLVDLFNELIGCSTSFDYDFGSGIQLVNGIAKVFIYGGIELGPDSAVSREQGQSSIQLNCPQGFRIIYKSSLEDLTFDDCSMRVVYSTENGTSGLLTRPTSVSIERCSRISYTNGTEPLNSEQSLPLLAHAFHQTARKYLTFRGSLMKVVPAQWEFVGYLMQRGIVGPAIC